MNVGFLAQMGWKSALICAVALMLMILLRSRSAADRSAVLRAAVLLLLLLPFISLGMPRLEIESSAVAPASAPAAEIGIPPVALPAIEAAVLPMAESAPEPLVSTELAIGIIYATGVLLLGLRLLAGLLMLRRWTAAARPARAAPWVGAMRRNGGEETRLLVSDHAPAPMSWGWRRPIILVDRETYARAEDADAILAHEMAHVARADWAALMLSRAAVALFWFNPLVWLVERQAVRHAEEAADCAAAMRVEPTHYAQTLVSCARRASAVAVPANSIAPSGRDLAVRVKAILDGSFRNRSSTKLTLAAIGGCVMFAVPVAAMELVAPRAPDAPLPPAPLAPPAPSAPAGAAPPALPAPPAPPAAQVSAAAPAPVAAPAAPPPAMAEPPQAVTVAAGAAVTPAVQSTPPAPPAPSAPPATPAPPARPRPVVDVDTLVAMRIHGATPEYAAEMARALGGLRPSIDQLVAMRIHGVSARYVRELADAGYRGLTPSQIVAMRIQGVSARAARRAGGRLTPEELIERTIHGQDED